MAKLRTFLIDERGATALEYALIAGLISILVVAGASSIGTTLNTKYYKPMAAGFS